MKKYRWETQVGVFVLAGILAVGWMSVKLGNLRLFGEAQYPVTARFTNISGLKVNAPVEMFGVSIGYVGSIGLDLKNNMAVVELMIDKDITLHDDAIASIKTSGLIGDKYVGIAPGGVGDEVGPGDELFETEPAIDIQALISKYVFGDVNKKE